MNSDYRVSISWRGNLKRKKLQRKLGPAGVLALMDLWSIAAEQRPDGVLTGWEKEDIELQGGWDGKPGELVSVLAELLLLDYDENSATYRIHDWFQWNHWAAGAEKRSVKARAAAEARWNKPSQENTNSNATSIPRASGEHASRNAEGMQGAIQDDASGNAPHPTHPYPTLPNPTPPPPNPQQGREGQNHGDGNGGGDFLIHGQNLPERIKEYLDLGCKYGGTGDVRPTNPGKWRDAALERIMQNQGGSLSHLDEEQARRWGNLEKGEKITEEEARLLAAFWELPENEKVPIKNLARDKNYGTPGWRSKIAGAMRVRLAT